MPKRAVHVVTNRDPQIRRGRTVGFGPEFSKGDAEDLRFARVEMTVADRALKTASVGPDDDDPGRATKDLFVDRADRARIELYEESILGNHANELEAPPNKVRYGSVALFDTLRKAMLERRDVLVYVHGYATNFDSALGDAFTLQERLASPDVRDPSRTKDPLVVLYTWPSDGRKTPWRSYRSDRLEAAASGAALGRALLKLRDFLIKLPQARQCGSNIHLLCHSMGNFVLQNALERLALHSPGQRLPRLLDQVFMVAADVDDDVLDEGGAMAALPDLCEDVHVYFNARDAALRISDATKANPARLGARGVARPGDAHQKVHQIDCTPWAQDFDRLVGHGYQTSRRVLRDMRVWMDGSLEAPGLRRPGPRTATWRI